MPDYFDRIQASNDTRQTYLNLIAAYDAAKAAGPRLATRARAIGAAIIDYRDGHLALARDSAREADGFIRGYIESSRGVGGGGKMRPKRSIRSGDMSGHVRSEALPGPVPYGEVGIARIDELDKVINPQFRSAGPYWRAQEYGTDAHLGRVVPGYFQPGQAAPDAGQFREHAYFQQVPYTPRSKIPAMVIRRPIIARNFLRDGTRRTVQAWRQRQAVVERNLADELRRIARL